MLRLLARARINAILQRFSAGGLCVVSLLSDYGGVSVATRTSYKRLYFWCSF